jgi:hypothetical protein
VQLVIAALAVIEDEGQKINRVTVGQALEGMTYAGVTGTVWKP